MSDVFFSRSISGFIPAAWKSDGTYTASTWPADAVELSQEEADTYWRTQTPEGKVLGSTSDGRPCWVDIPPPTHSELVSQADAMKDLLQRDAEMAIKPLERAKQLGIATDSELASLTEWERYSVLLMRVDTSLAPNVEWPQKPQ